MKVVIEKLKGCCESMMGTRGEKERKANGDGSNISGGTSLLWITKAIVCERMWARVRGLWDENIRHTWGNFAFLTCKNVFRLNKNKFRCLRQKMGKNYESFYSFHSQFLKIFQSSEKAWSNQKYLIFLIEKLFCLSLAQCLVYIALKFFYRKFLLTTPCHPFQDYFSFFSTLKMMTIKKNNFLAFSLPLK